MGAEVAKKVKILWQLLVGNFRQKHFLCTLVMGRRKVLCTGLVECGDVLVIPEKIATSWKEFPAAKTFRAAHTCRSRQRRAGDGVYSWISIKTS